MSKLTMCKIRGRAVHAMHEELGPEKEPVSVLVVDDKILKALNAGGLVIYDESTPLDEIPDRYKDEHGLVLSSMPGIEEARPTSRSAMTEEEVRRKKVGQRPTPRPGPGIGRR